MLYEFRYSHWYWRWTTPDGSILSSPYATYDQAVRAAGEAAFHNNWEDDD